MKYYVSTIGDVIHRSFDFKDEKIVPGHSRQRDAVYAHQLYRDPLYDGLLVSMSSVEPNGQCGSRLFSADERSRLLTIGAKRYFGTTSQTRIMGNSGVGVHTSLNEPLHAVDMLLYFYHSCRVDYGISVDHVIPRCDDEKRISSESVQKWSQQQNQTLDLAAEFWREHKDGELRFTPLGVARGWSPRSYAFAVSTLQKIGYSYIAIGGLTGPASLEMLRYCNEVRRPHVKFHLLGVSLGTLRPRELATLKTLGVVSYDSATPMECAVNGDHNYETFNHRYTAIPIPSYKQDRHLRMRIEAKEIDEYQARELERKCLRLIAEYDEEGRHVGPVLTAISEYERLAGLSDSRREQYRETLESAPWRDCPCDVCQRLQHHVVVLRGPERNRRRGFHNLWIHYRRLQAALGA